MKQLRPHQITVLVCYDICTTCPGGAKRLRRVEKICESYGQRVQYSVFEITLTPKSFEVMCSRLVLTINKKLDGVKIYYLKDDDENRCLTFGVDHYIDLSGPLIL